MTPPLSVEGIRAVKQEMETFCGARRLAGENLASAIWCEVESRQLSKARF